MDLNSSSPEMRLLLACARAYTAHSDESVIVSTSEVDWSCFLTLVRDHHLVPCVRKAITQHWVHADAPAWVNDELRKLRQRIAAVNTRLSHHLVQIERAMRTADVICVAIKGPVLAVQTCGSISARQFGDLDFIVSSDAFAKADQVLRTLGYCCRDSEWLLQPHMIARSLREALYVGRNAVYLDVHPVLVSHGAANRRQTRRMLKSAIEIEIEDMGPVLTFPPIEHALLLCMNGAKEMWEKLSDLVDLARLVEQFNQAEWECFLREAREMHQRRAVCVGLLLLKDVLVVELPMSVNEALARDTTAHGLASRAATRLLSGASMRQNGFMEGHFEISCRDNVRDRLRAICRYAMTPGRGDYAAIRMPRMLEWVYYLVRPIRMIGLVLKSRKNG